MALNRSRGVLSPTRILDRFYTAIVQHGTTFVLKWLSNAASHRIAWKTTSLESLGNLESGVAGGVINSSCTHWKCGLQLLSLAAALRRKSQARDTTSATRQEKLTDAPFGVTCVRFGDWVVPTCFRQHQLILLKHLQPACVKSNDLR